MKIKLLLLLISLSLTATLSRAQVFTTYTLPVDTTNTGSFSLADSVLYELEQLSVGGSNSFNYAYTVFTPTVSGNYTFGIQSANYDPVMILYSGLTSFPINPATNAIALNDDGGLDEFNGLTLNSQLNPVIENIALTANATYLVAITTFSSGDFVPLPTSFFVYGSATVVTEATPVPEPSTYAAIFGGLALGGAMLWRRRKQA